MSPNPVIVEKVLFEKSSTSNVLIGIGEFFCRFSNSFSFSVFGISSVAEGYYLEM